MYRVWGGRGWGERSIRAVKGRVGEGQRVRVMVHGSMDWVEGIRRNWTGGWRRGSEEGIGEE